MSVSDFNSSYFELTEFDDVVVINFNASRLNDEENIENLGDDMFSLVQNYNCRKVVASLTVVEYLTSSVLGKLITLHRRLHRSDGRLVVCNLQPTVRELMATSKLLTYFTVTETADEAVEILKKD